MTQESPDYDIDDLRRAIEDHRARRAPKDIVPRREGDAGRQVPTGPQSVTFTELTDNGITQHTGTAWITKPITRYSKEHNEDD